MLQAMNTGHDGSLTTLHAGSAEEAILRLVLMARFGIDLPASIIKGQIAMALDLIAVTGRSLDGSRVVGPLVGVSRADDDEVALDEIVSYEAEARRWHLVEEPPFVEAAVSQGVATREEVDAWRRSL